MNIFIIIDTKKAITPIINIPIAETFEICSNSFLVGFLRIDQTLPHLIKNVFIDAHIFTIGLSVIAGF